MNEVPIKLENTGRNPDGTFMVGHPDVGGGRPKGKTLKEYQAEQFRQMTDEEKELWLKMHRITGETRWKMAEGNPQTDLTSGGEVINPIPIYGGISINGTILGHESNEENIQPKEKNPSS